MSDSKHEAYSIFASHMHGGPQGKGDPDDRTLRNVEKDVLIPRKYVKPEAHKRCSEFVKEFSECGKREGLMMPFRCRHENQVMQECLVRWYSDKQFLDECTEMYLRDRRAYRLTGVSQKQKASKI